MKTVTNNSTVDVDYEGRTPDGKLFDTSNEELAKKGEAFIPQREYKPLHIKMGEGKLIKGFEDALMGMKEGEEKTVTIKADDAYGQRRSELIQSIKKDPERDKDVKEGMVVFVDVQERQLPAVVVEVSDNIVLDFNHPLAGKDLTFKLKVVKIED